MNGLVIGGGRGIGRAIAEGLADRGHRVGVVARTAREVEETARTLRDRGVDAWGFSGDALDPAAVRSAVERYVDRVGVLDTVIFAAGRFRGVGPLATVAFDDWWADLETTLKGFSHVVRQAVPFLRISETPSLITLIGPGHAGELAFGAGYGSAQAGLARLVESLAIELRADKVPVYAVNPGLVPTPMMTHLLESPEGRLQLPRFTEAFAEGKEVGPEVAAEMVGWLAENRPPQLNGRVVPSMVMPELLALRLARIEAEDLGKLRLR